MILVAIATVFSIYTFFLLKRRILLSFSLLQESAVAIQKGDYSYQIDITSKNEVGTLANTFNSMAHSIEERSSRLQATIESTTDGILVIGLERKITS